MFQHGSTVARIAAERGLTISTIEEYLSTFVASGELAIDTSLDPERHHLLEAVFDAMPEASLSEVKAAMGDEASYGELRLAAAHRSWLKRSVRRQDDAEGFVG